MVSSHDNNHFISRLEDLANIFQQLNKINLKLQTRGRTIVDLTDTSAHSWKNLTIGSENLKQEILLVRDLATVAGDGVNVDIASKVVQRLGGLRKEFVLYFPEIIKSILDLVKNRFVLPVENVADCMKDELIDLRNKSGTKYRFETNKICDFWLKVSDVYPNVWKEALR